MRLPLSRLLNFFEVLEKEPMDQAGKMVVEEILTRLHYLVDVGVGYLTLERQSRTLSGGEVQRVNLTTALGTSLVNTLFVLDEPSIGLHPRDMDRINRVMQKLKNSGNTLVVVEHDPQVMLAADTLFDMGPGPGEKGGEIIFKGSPTQILKANTLTARYLSGKEKVSSRESQRKFTKKMPAIELSGAREHNLKGISVRFPIGALCVVTGVSGSGKSTLIENILVPALYKAKGMPAESPGHFDALKGADLIENVHYVDQSPIGKTTRSNPASYVGAFDAIRNLFAQTDAAKAREYKAGTFSFNSGDGRCPVCGGALMPLGTSLRCPQGHSYDMAKEGYVNLLAIQRRHAADPGDGKAMVRARRAFLQAGYYAPFQKALAELCLEYAPECGETHLLDAGCGEGSYDRVVYDAFAAQGRPCVLAGFDLSKDAIRLAAKLLPEAAFAVGGSFSAPVRDGWADVLLNIFSPFAGQEFCRVLRSGGVLLYAVPTARHLYGLKEVLYDEPYENAEQQTEYSGFTLIGERTVTDTITVEGDQIRNLFAMTPYFWKTPHVGALRLAAKQSLTTEIGFRFLAYRRV